MTGIGAFQARSSPDSGSGDWRFESSLASQLPNAEAAPRHDLTAPPPMSVDAAVVASLSMLDIAAICLGAGLFGSWSGLYGALSWTGFCLVLRYVLPYNDGAGSSSESNTIASPARPLARPKSGGSVDSRRV